MPNTQWLFCTATTKIYTNKPICSKFAPESATNSRSDLIQPQALPPSLLIDRHIKAAPLVHSCCSSVLEGIFVPPHVRRHLFFRKSAFSPPSRRLLLVRQQLSALHPGAAHAPSKPEAPTAARPRFGFFTCANVVTFWSNMSKEDSIAPARRTLSVTSAWNAFTTSCSRATSSAARPVAAEPYPLAVSSPLHQLDTVTAYVERDGVWGGRPRRVENELMWMNLTTLKADVTKPQPDELQGAPGTLSLEKLSVESLAFFMHPWHLKLSEREVCNSSFAELASLPLHDTWIPLAEFYTSLARIEKYMATDDIIERGHMVLRNRWPLVIPLLMATGSAESMYTVSSPFPAQAFEEATSEMNSFNLPLRTRRPDPILYGEYTAVFLREPDLGRLRYGMVTRNAKGQLEVYDPADVADAVDDAAAQLAWRHGIGALPLWVEGEEREGPDKAKRKGMKTAKGSGMKKANEKGRSSKCRHMDQSPKSYQYV
ncbi:hypothetical protein B0H67DRAFT_554426 [Lasiosphaeris hirsuta]|uniref:Uncharacterized protein n=1 Tax=Lasiosphaeris hirsuta TaxID=260670 RepID=A0AA40DWC5_9PEZI|nr:hypothetical protein B0H67DRAFT_554426 [Lasiosphaeris hirsuta]